MDRAIAQTVYMRALCAMWAALGFLAAPRIRFLRLRIRLILRAAERIKR